MPGQTFKTTDPGVIRQWAAARAGEPAVMSARESDTIPSAIPCIKFPTDAYADAYDSISWQELFERMQKDKFVFVYQEKTVSGSTSRFCRFVSQEAAREVETEPETPDKRRLDATELSQTEALDTPQARGIAAFRSPQQVTRRTWRLLVGLAVLVVLALALIIGVFWPRT